MAIIMSIVIVMSYAELPVQDLLVDLASRIRSERLNRDLTQQQLADGAGVSVDTIRNLEAGDNTTLAVFVKVLRALGLEGRLELLIPAPMPSPIQVAEREGRVRERASGSRTSVPLEWTFEDPPDGSPPVSP